MSVRSFSCLMLMPAAIARVLTLAQEEQDDKDENYHRCTADDVSLLDGSCLELQCAFCRLGKDSLSAAIVASKQDILIF